MLAPIWRMNAFTPLARPPFVPTGGLRELLADGHVSAEFMFAITQNCPLLETLQELGVPLQFFSLVLAQTLSDNKLQRLTLIPSSRALGGIDAPALAARLEEIVRALGIAMIEFSSSGVEWEARNGIDSFIGYEGVKRILALAKARLDAGVRYEAPSAAKA
ncbi:hypothetical protein, variant [Microbotryum lychnidis-dioicae p1A1 Lamole]|uniref:Uncharacterized protein n=1 Tax=Microbotryum lychnidis-dioicae (strain p1A1 Lamole / MvSl-1064) TaxID=683840 RepID=U5HIJ6_USTV1|nr:hypothetical protein, variant [Microbotryum lychnidis-dioicae p1A1 Lamole]|eukprot:KDE02605.1 hypothetical protein, variant [Microbotryum lychnidis-dioicae p1A1 Lamole]